MKEKAAEMTGCGQRGKPKTGFPRRPRALGNRIRDSHIPAAPARFLLSKQIKTKGDQSRPVNPAVRRQLDHPAALTRDFCYRREVVAS
jgi:hypothetical protein